MKKYSKLLVALLLLISSSSCTNDSEDDLIDQQQGPDPITYTSDVKAIIDNNCLNCHSDPPTNGAPIPLVTYDDVKDATEGSLINRIQAVGGSSGAMPLGGPRLPQNLIDIIVQWEVDGLIE